MVYIYIHSCGGMFVIITDIVIGVISVFIVNAWIIVAIVSITSGIIPRNRFVVVVFKEDSTWIFVS